MRIWDPLPRLTVFFLIHPCSASDRMSTVSSGVSHFFLKVLTNLRTWAVTRSNLWMKLNCVMSIILLMRQGSRGVIDYESWSWIGLSAHNSGISCEDGVKNGRLSVRRQSGPFLRNCLVASSAGASPLDGMSARFSLPGEWLQISASGSLQPGIA